MKTVYANQELFHVYASGNVPHGRSHNGNVYFNGNTIYSYGEHFPLATRYKGIYLTNAESYSITTSKHQSQLARALSHCETLSLPALGVVMRLIAQKSQCKGNDYALEVLRANAVSYCDGMAREIKNATEKRDRARKQWSKDNWQRQIDFYHNAAKFVWQELAGYKSDPIAGAAKATRAMRKKSVMNAFEADCENRTQEKLNSIARVAAIKAIRALKGQRAVERDEEYQWRRFLHQIEIGMNKLNSRQLADNKSTHEFMTPKMRKIWLEHVNNAQRAYDRYLLRLEAHGRSQLRYYEQLGYDASVELFHQRKCHSINKNGPIVCRVHNDEVETSHGARVPLDDAMRIFQAARVCRRYSKEYNGAEYNMAERVGHYTLNHIDTMGNVKIGCHKLLWPQIEDCARRYMPQLLEDKLPV